MSASDFGGPSPPKILQPKNVVFNYVILRLYCRYLQIGTRYRRLENGVAYCDHRRNLWRVRGYAYLPLFGVGVPYPTFWVGYRTPTFCDKVRKVRNNSDFPSTKGEKRGGREGENRREGKGREREERKGKEEGKGCDGKQVGRSTPTFWMKVAPLTAITPVHAYQI